MPRKRPQLRGAKRDFVNNKIAEKAVDLQPFLDVIRDAKDIETKKIHATEMAMQFAVGGAETFLRSLEQAKTPQQVDMLVYNAALKGQGLGAKVY